MSPLDFHVDSARSEGAVMPVGQVSPAASFASAPNPLRPRWTIRAALVPDLLPPEADRDRLLELVDWLQEEHGPVTEDEHAAALAELEELDAGHERRQPAGGCNAGEAA
ncbi:hypothetical protein ACIRBZ_09480 [Streptomyces sp. NPDC094038]|uniref:hypothetical protein n=1 Tax=Streptomyces sp. NPDC094038 TaxID=3366055 RepID=UPI00380529D7